MSDRARGHGADDRMLGAIQRETFQQLVGEVNEDKGLVRDRTAEGSPASVTAVGLELAAYTVGAERGFVSWDEAIERTLMIFCHYDQAYPEMRHAYGYRCSFNPTFPSDAAGKAGWVSDGHYGLNQGPVALMIENHPTGLLWELMKRRPYLVTGLVRAGFSGGCLSRMERGRGLG